METLVFDVILDGRYINTLYCPFSRLFPINESYLSKFVTDKLPTLKGKNFKIKFVNIYENLERNIERRQNHEKGNVTVYGNCRDVHVGMVYRGEMRWGEVRRAAPRTGDRGDGRHRGGTPRSVEAFHRGTDTGGERGQGGRGGQGRRRRRAPDTAMHGGGGEQASRRGGVRP